MSKQQQQQAQQTQVTQVQKLLASLASFEGASPEEVAKAMAAFLPGTNEAAMAVGELGELARSKDGRKAIQDIAKDVRDLRYAAMSSPVPRLWDKACHDVPILSEALTVLQVTGTAREAVNLFTDARSLASKVLGFFSPIG